jgi:hypothetical protein
MKFVFLPLVLVSSLLAQESAPSAGPKKEVVTYTFHHPQVEPTDYKFQVTRDCQVTYESGSRDKEAKEAAEKSETAQNGQWSKKLNSGDSNSPESSALDNDESNKAGDPETVHKQFQLAPAECQQVFDLAKSTRYFDGEFEFKKHKVAYSGDQWLGYFAPGVRHRTHFTFSENPSIQQLSALFRGISATLEWESKLQHQRRYDRLGLNESLSQMEEQAKSGWLKDLDAIAPLLREIADDPQVMNIARQRAQRLLLLAQAGPSAK